ncbi:1,4-alpha-glucan branching protein GlgB [Tundrisphaera sp. TA3]|uniref:1,4-alpha-glucan branching protein GlgB n=1 Tax=Tundrisphaera sp. TA3 TaxID=3435775 RepID=UPI003EC003BE
MSVAPIRRGWDALLEGEARQVLERDLLPPFLNRQRWFAGKARPIDRVRIVDAVGGPGLPETTRLALISVTFNDGGTDRYFLPLGLMFGAEAEVFSRDRPGPSIGRLDRSKGGPVLVVDSLSQPGVGQALLEAIAEGRSFRGSAGTLQASSTSAFAAARGDDAKPLPARGGTAEQSNSAVIYGDRLILKIFRRLEPGINPDFEIGRFLSERTDFHAIPRTAGALIFESEQDGGQPLMIGILQGLVPNQGTGWEHALRELGDFYRRIPSGSSVPAAEGLSWTELAGTEPPAEVADAIGSYLKDAATLGRRTAELHRAMASDPDDPAFAPARLEPSDLAELAGEIRTQVETALDALRSTFDRLPAEAKEQATGVLAGGPSLLAKLDALPGLNVDSTRIRVHGDYHLGQVLRTDDDFVILDFEGEPAKPFARRVAKQIPLKDVVGMIRSFDYAAFAALFAHEAEYPGSFEALAPWAKAWRSWVSASFLRSYLDVAEGASFLPADRSALSALLDAQLLDKALYELLYELNNRPDWVRIPLQGIAALIPPAASTSSPPAETTRKPSSSATDIGDFDLHLLAEGNHWRSYDKLGAHLVERDGVSGTRFVVWAPNARAVGVIGPFNDWHPDADPMSRLGHSGLWERFIPGVGPGMAYKYAMTSAVGDYRADKADPYAFAAEVRPGTASRVADLDAYAWKDQEWMANRAAVQASGAPQSIYEVHLGSWMRGPDHRWLTYAELAEKLADYVLRMGFTHVELMPIAEHPFDGSWGYQVTAYFAPTSRFGTPDEFMGFIDALHAKGIGVILDWVPAHFPRDEHGLGYFDGTHLYEHSDPRQGLHKDWNTAIFNFGRPQVVNFLIANALFWLDKYHIDGLRVDAVASMLYRDYSRQPGEWVPNEFGGRENLEAIALLRKFNEQVHSAFPDVLTIAEESTAWPMVSKPTSVGGLGFDLKWDLGWMHDTLSYFEKDPIHRRHHHNQLTFRGLYAYTENFVLPLSHDEVVYGKGSLLAKMPGDTWQRFANLRLLLGYQYALPGKKLLFMGDEFGQWREWDHDGQLDWGLLDDPMHSGLKRWVRDLNTLYRGEPAWHVLEQSPEGFVWVDANDAEQSVLSFIRRGPSGDDLLLFVANFTPVPRHNYRVGVPRSGRWEEILNGDAPLYGGSGQGNIGGASTAPVSAHGHHQSLNLTLPPLAIIAFRAPR